MGFFPLPSRTAVNAQTGVCTPAGGLVTGEPHPFFTLGGKGGGEEPTVLYQVCVVDNQAPPYLR